MPYESPSLMPNLTYNKILQTFYMLETKAIFMRKERKNKMFLDAQFLAMQQINAKIILQNLCQKDNCNFIFKLAKNDAKNASYLLKLLNRLSTSLPINKVMSVLNLRDESGANFGMLLAEHQSDKINQEYMSFLLKLYRLSTNAEAIIACLHHQDENGMTYAMILAKNKLSQTLMDYMEWLDLFVQEKASLIDIHHLMLLQDDEKNDLAHLLIINNQAAALTKAISKGLFPISYFEQLAPARQILMDYIMQIKDEFIKKNMLRDALDLEHPLGRLFHSQESYWQLVSFINEKSTLETQDKKNWAEFFPKVKEEDIDSYLYFIDPYQARMKY